MNYQERVEKGKEKAARSRCVITGCARDIHVPLPHIIPQVEELSKRFAEAKIFVYENDSKDNTRKLLNEWQSRNRIVTCAFADLGYPRMADLSVKRIQYMSEYRNFLLRQIQMWLSHYDYLIMLDFDLIGFDIDGVMNTFGWDKWDAMGSNGRKHRSMSKKKDVYYDIFGHRELDEECPRTDKAFNRGFARLQDKYRSLKRGDPLVPVASCFNGMAVYPIESVLGCWYSAHHGYAEHVGLHKEMAERGNNKIFINPSQLTYYDEAMRGIYSVGQNK